ncbi:hypothetical protein F5888DRAFT_841692 [Russula emetica]|nr:hypothetical protein F5888DRAFT_841692 [Russula emetica]
MIFDDEKASARNEKNGFADYGAPDSDFRYSPPPGPPPGPPPYHSSTRDASTSSAVVVASPSGHTIPVVTPPSDVPTNGLNIFTVIEPIRGSWLLDPLAPQSSGTSVLQTIVQNRGAGRRPHRVRNMTLGTPTAKLDSRHGNISAALRVVGESAMTATATIRTTTRSGNIVLELVSKSPTRTVHFDAYSRSGNISLLIPRSFSGIVELRARNGGMELLPALASSARIMRTSDKETVVLVGNNAIPQVGASPSGDLARLSARSGSVRLGFSGEDAFNESGGIMSNLFQKITTRLAGS